MNYPNFSTFSSRTFWTILAMVVVGGGNAIIPILPPAFQTAALAILGVIATYYHVNPSQVYNQSSIAQ